VKPGFYAPNLRQFRKMHLLLCANGCYPTRQDVWRCHWIFCLEDEYYGELTLREHMEEIQRVVTGLPRVLEPVIGLCSIDQKFLKACYKLRNRRKKLRRFLRSKYEAEVDGYKFFGPDFGAVRKKHARRMGAILNSSTAMQGFEAIRRTGWIQPLAPEESKLGEYACASGFVAWPSRPAGQDSGRELEDKAAFAPCFLSTEQLYALCSKTGEYQRFMPTGLAGLQGILGGLVAEIVTE